MLNKKTLFLIGFFLVLLITLLLVTFVFKGPSKIPTPPVILNQTQYPQIQIIKPNTNITPLNNIQQLNFPTKLSLYEVSLRAPISEKDSEKLANSFGINKIQTDADNELVFDHHQSQGEDVYLWQQNGKSLVQFPKSGVFEYSAPLSGTERTEDIQKATQAVLNLLSTNNLLPTDYNLYTEYILLPNFSVATKDNFTAYRITIEPKVDNIPILSFKNSGNMITAYLAKDYSFFKFDYYFVPVTKTEQTINIKPLTGLIDNIYSNKISPSFFYLPNNTEYFDPNNVNINQINIQKADLVYYLSSRNDQTIYPTYKITNQIKTVDNLIGSSIYLIPAY